MTHTAEYQNARTDSSRGTKTAAYAALSATTPIEPFEIERRAPRPNDVTIDILYCGVCHSDIHQSRDEWGGAIFPMVPGHEIVGRVTGVGSAVTKFKVGDLAGVGCMVDSCRVCENCRRIAVLQQPSRVVYLQQSRTGRSDHVRRLLDLGGGR